MPNYTKSAALYDAIYASLGKDYGAEALRLHELIQQHKRSPGKEGFQFRVAGFR